VIDKWSKGAGITASRGVQVADWQFSLDVCYDGRLQGSLKWEAVPVEGVWGNIKASLRVGGVNSHFLEFKAVPVKGNMTQWSLQAFYATDGSSLAVRFLSEVYSQTGQFFRCLSSTDSRILRPSMVFGAVWMDDKKAREYIHKGVSLGNTPVMGGWA